MTSLITLLGTLSFSTLTETVQNSLPSTSQVLEQRVVILHTHLLNKHVYIIYIHTSTFETTHTHTPLTHTTEMPASE